MREVAGSSPSVSTSVRRIDFVQNKIDSFFVAFSMKKPPVLPGVGKKALAKQNLRVTLVMVWRPHHKK